MQLQDYLALTGITEQDFADWIGVKQSAVSGWVTGRRTPNREHIAIIYRRTSRRVGPQDWPNARTAARRTSSA